MSNYFEVLNDSGALLINDKFNNLHISKIATVTLSNVDTLTITMTGVSIKGSLPDFSECIIIGVSGILNEGVTGGVMVQKEPITDSHGSILYYEWVATAGVTSSNTIKSVDVTFYGFIQGTDSSSTRGLEVYDASGIQVFSSEQKYFRVVHYTGITPVPSSIRSIQNAVYPTHTVPPGKKYAYVSSVPYMWTVSGPQGAYWAVIYYICGGMYTASNNTIGPCNVLWRWYRFPAAATVVGPTYLYYSYFIIDVTGY